MNTCECCDPEAAAARDAAEAADLTPPMGVEPSAPDCRCHLCEPPGRELDVVDARTVRKVFRYGWQVVGVQAGSGPGFAYTVGLPHRADHAELLMSGLDHGVMKRCLDDLSRRILDGARYGPGDVVEGVLPHVPVLLERVRPSALADTVIWSRRLHRRRVDALQVVWPDTAARFGWQPGAPAELRSRQPASWRVPSPHLGMLAPDPVWPLASPADSLAIACVHIAKHGAVPLWTTRFEGEPGSDIWVFACETEHSTDLAHFTASHLAHVVRSSPSLAELTGLPFGRWADRPGPEAPWTERRG